MTQVFSRYHLSVLKLPLTLFLPPFLRYVRRLSKAFFHYSVDLHYSESAASTIGFLNAVVSLISRLKGS